MKTLKPNALYVAIFAALAAPAYASFLEIPAQKAALPKPLLVIEETTPVVAPLPAEAKTVEAAKAIANKAAIKADETVAAVQAPVELIAANTTIKAAEVPLVLDAQKISVHFPFSSTAFQPSDEARKRIHEAVQNVRGIDIAGFSDNRGTPEGNATAALRRALSARQYLMEKEKVFEMRIKVSEQSGRFIASNDTEEGRARNRRVDMVFHPAVHRSTVSNQVLAVVEQPAPAVVAEAKEATDQMAEKPSSVVVVDTLPEQASEQVEQVAAAMPEQSVSTEAVEAIAEPTPAVEPQVVVAEVEAAERQGFWQSLFGRNKKTTETVAATSELTDEAVPVVVKPAPVADEAPAPIIALVEDKAEPAMATAKVTTVQPVAPKVTSQAPTAIVEQQVIVAAAPPLPTQSPVKPTWTLRAGQPIHSQLQNWAAQAGWAFTWNMERSWIIPAEASFDGSFDEALEQVIVSLYMEGHPIRLAIWEGNRLAEVAITDRR